MTMPRGPRIETSIDAALENAAADIAYDTEAQRQRSKPPKKMATKKQRRKKHAKPKP